MDPNAATFDNLQADALTRIRHDLRTFVNHMLGYSEMLAEVAEEEGQADQLPALTRIQEISRQLLTRIAERLPHGREFQPLHEVQAMGREIHRMLGTLKENLQPLVETARERRKEEFLHDLQKIADAIAGMGQFLQTELKPGKPHEEIALANDDKIVQSEVAGSARILVVDDNDTNRDMLQRRLERQGYAVLQARHGQEALSLIDSANPDLVLLDILMPIMDGFQVLETVKATPKGRDLPIIMISSLDEIQSVVRCIEMGAEDFLPKPFDPVLLRARVGACLEKKRLRDQELDYLRQVETVTAAAAQVEAGKFDPAHLDPVSVRDDSLGQLARVFQRMGREVQAREERLQNQVRQLTIEIDESRKTRQVAEVTETEYFQELQKKARDLRRRSGKSSTP